MLDRGPVSLPEEAALAPAPVEVPAVSEAAMQVSGITTPAASPLAVPTTEEACLLPIRTLVVDFQSDIGWRIYLFRAV